MATLQLWFKPGVQTRKGVRGTADYPRYDLFSVFSREGPSRRNPFGSPDDDGLLHRNRVTCGKRLLKRFVKQPVLFGSSFVGLFGVHGARLMKRLPMPANSASLVFSTVRNELCQGRQELAAQKCERVDIG